MIPLRVELKNFLCHTEQVFDFEGEPVWLLHGPNGVGKSAVFDAMLYCLFGEYQRREKSDVKIGDLLRHGESSMEVKFDFEYRGKRYRVWRGRTRRGSSSQGVAEFFDGQPVPISSINQKGDLDRWVLDTLGLTEEAFVSAVLLRQGNAERLIDKKSKDRDEIFEGIIDLEPFKQLHEQAVEARRLKNADTTSLKRQLDLKKPVTDEEIAAANGLVAESAARWDSAQAAAGAARDLIEQARHWEALRGELTALAAQMEEAETRRLNAERLERDVARLKELRSAIPILERVRKSKSDATTAASAHRTNQANRQEVQTRIDATQKAIAKLRTAIVGLQEERRLRAEALTAAESQSKSLSDEIGRAEQAAELHATLVSDRMILAAIPADLDSHFAAAESAVADAQSARDALPSLRTLQQQGATFRAAAKSQKMAAESIAMLTVSVAGARTEDAAALSAEKAASEAMAASREKSAAIHERVNAVKAAQEQLKSVKGKKECSVCLQPIGPQHVESEGRELAKKLKLAEAELAEAQAAVEERKREELASKQRRVKSAAELLRVEKSLEQAMRDRDGAVNTTEASRIGFQTAIAELADPWKAQVAAIEVEGFPAASDVGAATQRAGGLAARKAELDTRTHQQQQRMQLTAAVDKGRKAVAAIGAPADVSAARTAYAELEKLITALKAGQTDFDRRYAAANTEEEARSQEHTKLMAELSAAVESASATAAKLAVAEHERGMAEAVVPEAYRGDLDLPALVTERDGYERDRVEEEFDALAADRQQHEHRRQQSATISAKLEAIPEPARRPTAEVQKDHDLAARAVKDANDSHGKARSSLEALERAKADRTKLEADHLAAIAEFSLHNRLVELLGDTGIQRALTADARKRIVDYADENLVRLSRGELRFDLELSTIDDDIRVRRTGCPDPIAVGNLSGGQRCRVAVSLALAVCRFASGQARPLESVIIDEAFANLDRDGRLAMIEALKDGTISRGLLKRIIVVSHHEDVLAAFDNGYRLVNDAGRTVVSRL